MNLNDKHEKSKLKHNLKPTKCFQNPSHHEINKVKHIYLSWKCLTADNNKQQTEEAISNIKKYFVDVEKKGNTKIENISVWNCCSLSPPPHSPKCMLQSCICSQHL